jgi:VWFA-related protein
MAACYVGKKYNVKKDSDPSCRNERHSAVFIRHLRRAPFLSTVGASSALLAETRKTTGGPWLSVGGRDPSEPMESCRGAPTNILVFLQRRQKIEVKRAVRIHITLIAILIGIATVAAQDFRVRTNVDLVVVPVSVRDGDRLVYGLTKEDFTVLEDNVPQTISNFSADPQPLSAAIVLDTGMGGIALRRLVPLFISITNGFSEFDEMAAFRYDHFVFQLSDFTSDHEKVEKSFDVVKTIAAKQPAYVSSGDPAPSAPNILRTILGLINLGGNGAVIDNPSPGMAGPVRRPTTETVPTVRSNRVEPSRALFDAICEAAKALETRPDGRRRIIFIVSDGQVTANQNVHSFAETTDLLLRYNIELYSVNTDTDPVDRKFGVLGSLARATGGDEYRGLNTASMERAFSRITEQARNQYVLGYHSTNELKGDLPTVRTIEVKGRNSKWDIKHRKGYTQVR